MLDAGADSSFCAGSRAGAVYFVGNVLGQNEFEGSDLFLDGPHRKGMTFTQPRLPVYSLQVLFIFHIFITGYKLLQTLHNLDESKDKEHVRAAKHVRFRTH